MIQQAKALLQQQPTRKVTFVYLLSTMGLTLFINLFLSSQFLSSLLWGDGSLLDGQGTVLLFLLVLSTVFGWVMSFGYQQWALRVSRGQSPPMSSLIEGFGIFQNVLFAILIKGLFMYLWLLTFLFATIIPLAIFMGLAGSGVAQLMFITVPLFIVICAVMWLHIRYCLTTFVLSDDPSHSSWNAVKKAVALQRSQFKPLLRLHLSFWKGGILFFMSTLLYYFLGYGVDYLTQYSSFAPYADLCQILLFILSSVLEWLILAKLAPLYYVTLALFYQQIPQITPPSYQYHNR